MWHVDNLAMQTRLGISWHYTPNYTPANEMTPSYNLYLDAVEKS